MSEMKRAEEAFEAQQNTTATLLKKVRYIIPADLLFDFVVTSASMSSSMVVKMEHNTTELDDLLTSDMSDMCKINNAIKARLAL